MSQQYGWTPPPPSYGRVAVPPPASTLAPARPTLGSSVVFIGAWLVLLWVLEALDAVLLGALDGFGVSPRVIAELPQVLTAPFLHFGFGHLMANTIPFLVLGTLTRMSGRREFWVATLSSIVVSGLLTWLISAPGSVTAGASGLVFGWLVYLLLRGLFARNWVQILIAAAVFGFFGGMLWGVFPTLPGVSWQAHLGGILGGVLAAWGLHRKANTAPGLR